MALALKQEAANIANHIKTFPAGSTAVTDLTAIRANLLASARDAVNVPGTGFHLVQPGETLASIAASVRYSADLLGRLNDRVTEDDGVYWDAGVCSVAVGSMIRVPIQAIAIGAQDTPLPFLPNKNRAYIFDTTTKMIYVVPSELDDDLDGALVVLRGSSDPGFRIYPSSGDGLLRILPLRLRPARQAAHI